MGVSQEVGEGLTYIKNIGKWRSVLDLYAH